jgi:hypothetical protein
MRSLLLFIAALPLAAGCGGNEPAPSAVVAPAPAAAPAPALTPPASPDGDFKQYLGTYTADKSVCDLQIQLMDQGGKLTFQSGGVAGTVNITKDSSDTYLTFVGLKGASPKVDVEGAFQVDKVVIQNDGNAMNPYTRFEQCDVKYLELVRQ